MKSVSKNKWENGHNQSKQEEISEETYGNCGEDESCAGPPGETDRFCKLSALSEHAVAIAIVIIIEALRLYLMVRRIGT